VVIIVYQKLYFEIHGCYRNTGPFLLMPIHAISIIAVSTMLASI
jgi:hypothetical protein